MRRSPGRLAESRFAAPGCGAVWRWASRRNAGRSRARTSRSAGSPGAAPRPSPACPAAPAAAPCRAAVNRSCLNRPWGWSRGDGRTRRAASLARVQRSAQSRHGQFLRQVRSQPRGGRADQLAPAGRSLLQAQDQSSRIGRRAHVQGTPGKAARLPARPVPATLDLGPRSGAAAAARRGRSRRSRGPSLRRASATSRESARSRYRRG